MAKEIRFVVKRKGKTEEYDKRKVYTSVYSAALNCHYTEKKSEKIAGRVEKKISSWIRKKKVVNAESIKKEVISELEGIDNDVVLMYKHHLDLS